MMGDILDWAREIWVRFWPWLVGPTLFTIITVLAMPRRPRIVLGFLLMGATMVIVVLSMDSSARWGWVLALLPPVLIFQHAVFLRLVRMPFSDGKTARPDGPPQPKTGAAPGDQNAKDDSDTFDVNEAANAFSATSPKYLYDDRMRCQRASRRLAVVLLALAFAGSAAVDADVPARDITVRCVSECRLSEEPRLGEAVRVHVEPGNAAAWLVQGRTKCQVPCTLKWPGAKELSVTVAGNHFHVEVGQESEPYALPKRGPLMLDAPNQNDGDFELKLKSMDTTNLVGNEVKPVPVAPGDASRARPESLTRRSARAASPPIVGGEAVPSEFAGADHEDVVPISNLDKLDTYLLDVVLLTGPQLGCTGVVVGSRHVLTARHCASVTKVGVSRAGGGVDTFEIARRAFPADAEIDAAILVVNRDLGVPVRPRIQQMTSEPATGVVRLAGFGANDVLGRRGFGLKRDGIVPVTSWSCDAVRRRITHCAKHEITFAAPEADACLGDSGGPVLDHQPDGWRLVAIASRGVPGQGTACGRGGVYTHVGALATWINGELSKAL